MQFKRENAGVKCEKSFVLLWLDFNFNMLRKYSLSNANRCGHWWCAQCVQLYVYCVICGIYKFFGIIFGVAEECRWKGKSMNWKIENNVMCSLAAAQCTALSFSVRHSTHHIRCQERGGGGGGGQEERMKSVAFEKKSAANDFHSKCTRIESGLN